jgi:hypothetical protein
MDDNWRRGRTAALAAYGLVMGSNSSGIWCRPHLIRRPRSSSCRRSTAAAAAAAGHGMMKQLHEGDRMSAHMIMIIIAFFSIHHGGLVGRLIGAVDWCDWAFRLDWATRMNRNALSDVQQLLVVLDGSVWPSWLKIRQC